MVDTSLKNSDALSAEEHPEPQVPSAVDNTVPPDYFQGRTPVLVIMGVAGCGKTTMNEHLGNKLGWDMAEADDFHPQANIDKMARGIPLNDQDRWPWLDSIHDWIEDHMRRGVPDPSPARL